MKTWIGTGLAMALMVAICVAGRLMPHLPNCTPLAAVALFSGFVFRDRRVALAVPLAAMVISDGVIGTYDWRIMIVVYVGLSLPVFLSRCLKGKWFGVRLAGCALLSSVLFFLTSNLAVWGFSGFYSLDLAGLTQCFLAASAFFKYTLLGDAVWTSVFFGAYAVSKAVQHDPGAELSLVQET